MPTYGNTLLDLKRLEEEKDLPRLLETTRDLARLSHLLILGLKGEEEHSSAPPDYDDWALVSSILWPLERACECALKLELDQRPASPVDPPAGPLHVVREGGA
jgi:hypothetical protein